MQFWTQDNTFEDNYSYTDSRTQKSCLILDPTMYNTRVRLRVANLNLI